LPEVDLILRRSSCHKKGGFHCVPFVLGLVDLNCFANKGVVALNLLIIFVGYVIPKQTLVSTVIWFGWLFYVNPISYGYESVMTNEFVGRTMPCNPSQLVPQGPGVDPR
jgi:hypothetical protein